MKKCIRLLCMLMLSLILALSAMPAALAESNGYVKRTNYGSINLRSEPSSNSQVIGAYVPYTPLEVDWVEGKWAHVYIGGKQGYMYSDYVEILTPQNVVYMSGSPTAANSAGYPSLYNQLVPADAYRQYIPRVINTTITENTVMYVSTGNSGKLHLREYASQGARSLGLYPNGTQVLVLNRQNGWAYVEVKGVRGYMSLDYLTSTYYRQPQPVPGVPETRYVSTGNSGKLHLREYASQNARSLGLFPNGTQISAVNLHNGWSYVEVNGKQGYMMTQFLSRTAPVNPYPAPVPGYTVKYVRTGNAAPLNLRLTPSTDAVSLGQFVNNTPVYVLKDYGVWSQVMVNGIVGYMMNYYLSSTPSQPSPKPAPQPTGTATVVHPNNSFVYLRSSRSTDNTANVLAKVPSGAKVTVYERDEWYSLVSYNGITGYMVSHYLYNGIVPTTPGSPNPSQPSAPAVPASPVIGHATVQHPNGSYVNLRSSRSSSENNVLVHVPSGAQVDVMEIYGNWAKIRYNGTVGYMVYSYLYGFKNVTPETPPAPPADPPAPPADPPAPPADPPAPSQEPAAG